MRTPIPDPILQFDYDKSGDHVRPSLSGPESDVQIHE